MTEVDQESETEEKDVSAEQAAPSEVDQAPQTEEKAEVDQNPPTAKKNALSVQTKDTPTQTQSFEQFQKIISSFSDTESKLQMTIDFMEVSLSQKGTPHFRNFWEARKLCLELFKENIPSALRLILWEKYTELSREARRLKEILDEQCAFAVEQIEMAIAAIEVDLSQVEKTVKATPLVEFPFISTTVQKEEAFYQSKQTELNILNAFASRINALRKELIKTEMRVKQKNKFFKRLSSIGDGVFPKRKALIKEVSHRFVADVDAFISGHFNNGSLAGPLFNLRDEIKALQCIAKFLTLNTHSFNHTRASLSACWDQIKQLEKERKKERAERKSLFRKNTEDILQKIAGVTEEFSTSQLSIPEARQKCSEISTFMRDVDLGRDEVVRLKEELSKAQNLIFAREAEEAEKKREKEREKERLRAEQFELFRSEVEQVVADGEDLELAQLVEKQQAFVEQQKSGDFTKREKQTLKSHLNQLKDAISKKKEQAIIASSGDLGARLQELREILSERLERRKEVKGQIEIYRLAKGASASDFEQAWSQTLLLNAEKERLEEIERSIKEVEEKIAELEKQIGI